MKRKSARRLFDVAKLFITCVFKSFISVILNFQLISALQQNYVINLLCSSWPICIRFSFPLLRGDAKLSAKVSHSSVNFWTAEKMILCIYCTVLYWVHSTFNCHCSLEENVIIIKAFKGNSLNVNNRTHGRICAVLPAAHVPRFCRQGFVTLSSSIWLVYR